MAYYNTTFLGYLTSGNIYVASSGLTNVVFKAQPSESIVSSATEVAVGLYQWLVPDVSYAYKLYVNGNVVSNWGGPTGRFVPTTDLATISYVDVEIAGRVHREGDTLLGPYYLTYAPTGNGMNVIEMTGGNVSNSAVPTKGYVDARISASTGSATSLTSTFVTILTNQTIYGQKTFYLNPSEGLQMQMQSDPPNGGVIGWNSKPLSSNKMLHDYKNSALTGTGNILCSTASINTSSSKYITGNLASNDFVHLKYLIDNYQPLVTPYQSNTVYVDVTATEDIPLKTYRSLSGAFAGILEETGGTTSANIWSVIVRQHNDVSGYFENVDFPDWVNVIGEGMVNIYGQLTRSTTGTMVTSKMQNLIFTNGGFDHNVQRFEAVDCVFVTPDNINLERSNLRNCEFYATSIISSNNNKLKGCFGNRAIGFQSNDDNYDYQFIAGASYN